MRRSCGRLTTRGGRRRSVRRGVLRRVWLVVLAVGVLLAGFSSLAASDPLDPHLTGFDWFVSQSNPPIPDVPTVAYPFGLEATYDGAMPGWVRGSIFEWIDGDWSLLTDSCNYYSCVIGVDATPPEEISRPHDRRFRIVLYSDDDPYDSMDLVVHEKRPHYNIDVDVESSAGYFMTHIDYAMGNTDLSTVIHDDGDVAESCNVTWNNCFAEITAGHVYYASVEDRDGNVYGISPSYLATSSTTMTKETADKVDLVRLGALYATTTDVCNMVLTYQGTHFANSTDTDQHIACEAAVTARYSMSNLLRAVAAAGGGTAVLWWLEHQVTIQTLSPSWPTRPWPDAEVPAIEDLPQVWQGAVINVADHYMLQARGKDLAQAAAMTIAAACLWNASRITNAREDCASMPIFFTGSDVAEATNHDIEAIVGYPAWVKLNYEYGRGKEAYQDRNWYRSVSPCDVRGRTGQQCDEYPFWATEQGGSGALVRPHLRYIDGDDNGLQGGRFGNFVTSCGLRSGSPPRTGNARGGTAFLMVPVPPALGIPTTYLCNR